MNEAEETVDLENEKKDIAEKYKKRHFKKRMMSNRVYFFMHIM